MELKSLMNSKKGVLGLDTAKAVMVWFLVLSILAIVIIITLSSLRDPIESVDKSRVIVVNETLVISNVTSTNLAYVDSSAYRHSVCSVTGFINATGGELIPGTNYTGSLGNCSFIGIAGGDYIEESSWYVSYTADYSNPETNLIVGNITGALTNDFFDQTGTIFAIIIVVVIIMAISIIIAVVTRFTAGGGAVGGGGGSGGYGSDTMMGI